LHVHDVTRGEKASFPDYDNKTSQEMRVQFEINYIKLMLLYVIRISILIYEYIEGVNEKKNDNISIIQHPFIQKINFVYIYNSFYFIYKEGSSQETD
jgi:hypothetical protein